MGPGSFPAPQPRGTLLAQPHVLSAPAIAVSHLMQKYFQTHSWERSLLFFFLQKNSAEFIHTDFFPDKSGPTGFS